MRTNNGLQVFVVEDNAIIRNLVVASLQEHGYKVAGAATAEDAMQRLASAPAPLLALTDIDLGARRSGLEFADWLHGQWPELNVIFATGRPDRLDGRASDPRETCLGKPFSLAELVERVRSALPAPITGYS